MELNADPRPQRAITSGKKIYLLLFQISHLFGELAGLFGRVEDFVVEDGEVERESEPDGVRGLHLGLGDLEGLLVGLLGVLEHSSAAVSGGDLSEVPERDNKIGLKDRSFYL